MLSSKCALEVIIDIYVQVEEGKNDFFPIGRAMSLSYWDENVMEEKLKEINAKVDKLLYKQQQLVSVSFLIKWLGH